MLTLLSPSHEYAIALLDRRVLIIRGTITSYIHDGYITWSFVEDTSKKCIQVMKACIMQQEPNFQVMPSFVHTPF